MRILITNDDGIDSPAIAALAAAVADLGAVTVAAPATEQSACGHGLTIRGAIEVQRRDIGIGGVDAYAVWGRPADCVKIAWCQLIGGQPDIVLSGINLGANIGINTLYSGTVAGAAEAVILGAPAVAFSIETIKGVENDIAAAAGWSRRLLDKLIADGLLDAEIFYNINFPAGCSGDIRGVRLCRQCASTAWGNYKQFDDSPQGRQCYRLHGDYGFTSMPDHTDAALIADGNITITPMTVDKTAHAVVQKLADTDFNV